MRTNIRIIVCAGLSLGLFACTQRPVEKRPVVEPRGAITEVSKSDQDRTQSDAGRLTLELNAQKSLRRVAELAAAIESGDGSGLTSEASGDSFLEAAYALLKADRLAQIERAIAAMQSELKTTKADTPRHNLGSILLNEARDRQELMLTSNRKESEISRLKRDAFLLQQKLAETQNKLRELATIEDELTRSRDQTPPASQ